MRRAASCSGTVVVSRLIRTTNHMPQEKWYRLFSSVPGSAKGQKSGNSLDEARRGRESLRADFPLDKSELWCTSKRNLEYPNFVHNTTKEALLLKCWSDRAWAKARAGNLGTTNSVGARFGVNSSGLLQNIDRLGKKEALLEPGAWVNFCKHGFLDEACQALDVMGEQGIFITRDMLYRVLKECIAKKNAVVGRHVHALTVRNGYESNSFLGNHLIRMYASCGRLQEAIHVFSKLPAPTGSVWTTIISACTENGEPDRAITLYKQMRQTSEEADSYLYVTVLKACGNAADLTSGRLVHSDVIERRFEKDLYVVSALVSMYAKCRSLEDSRKVFDRVSSRNLVIWNAIIAAYAQLGPCHEALQLYERMQQGGIVADKATFLSILKACSSTGAIQEGKQVHAQVLESELAADLFVGSALVDMYAKCGSMDDAREVFDRLPRRDAVTWGAMIAGYAQHGLGQEALQLYAVMLQEGMLPDSLTFRSILKACGSIGAVQDGKRIHAQILEKRLGQDPLVTNSLIDMYAKCGSMEEARRVFDDLQTKDVAAWCAMITGYAQHGLGREALAMHAQWQQEGKLPTNVNTYVSLLKSCGSLGAIQEGKQVHKQILTSGLEADVIIGNSLVDMYVKCGSLREAQTVFDRLGRRDVVTWTTLIHGYGQHNDSEMAMKYFQEMLQQGIEPDAATFTCILVACSHVGLVDEGQRYFQMMVQDHGILPGVEHYTCMVDLLGRSGRLAEGEKLLETMPFKGTSVGWRCLLSSCKTYSNVELGRRCFNRLTQIEPRQASCYVLMSDLYANAGMWQDAQEIEQLRLSAGAEKKLAKAVIEVNNQVHEFTVGTNSDDTSAKLRSLTSHLDDQGHDPQLDLVLKSMSEKEKEDALCGHAEKLAVAFGLLNTPEGTTLLVTKNLRMCSHCHSGTKIISGLEKREIIVRDAHRIHHFKNGQCSCGDDK